MTKTREVHYHRGLCAAAGEGDGPQLSAGSGLDNAAAALPMVHSRVTFHLSSTYERRLEQTAAARA